MKRHRIIPLIIVLAIINGSILYLLPRYRFDSIVLHHSASWRDNYESIRAFHRTRWPIRDAAYHLILSNGRTKIPTGHLEPTGRYRYLSYSIATKNPVYNLRAVHVCVIGNYHERPVPKAMQPIIGHSLRTLMDTYRIPPDRITFHRDVGQTVCPGRYITKPLLREWIAQADQCPASVRTQQSAVINHAGYSFWTFPRPVFAFMAVLSLLFASAWMIAFRIFTGPKRGPEMRMESFSQAAE